MPQRKRLVLSLFAVAMWLHGSPRCFAQAAAPLKLVQTIPMPQVKCHNPALTEEQLSQSVNTEFMPSMTCHFDRFGLDLKGGRLFAVAENDGTIEVYAVPSGKFLHSIGGFGMSHNVIYRADVNRIYATDGNHTDGLLRIFDGTTYQLIKTIKLLPDADSMDYDPVTHNLYITNGGDFANLDYTLLSIVNTDKNEHVGDIKFNTGRLEHMVVEKSGTRLFITSPNKREVDVIDRNRRTFLATWPVNEGQLCVAADFDEAHRRFFVTCRSGTLNVLDSNTGKAVAALPIAKGTDDVVYDAERKRIYIASAEGFLEVYRQIDPDHYELMGRVKTGPMGKNLMLVNSLNRLYVAVPRNGNAEAKILAYAVQ
jgi:DNA-binding beta-propeller fold protein YncE